jgi:TorA maturation chaperone TorD
VACLANWAANTIPAPPGTDREIFDCYLAPWIARFFTDLEQAPSAKFYATVGSFGRTFVAIETQGFELPG